MPSLLKMSIFSDHTRCLDILTSDDPDAEDARKLVKDGLKNVKMTLGKHRGKTFFDIFVNQKGYVWWLTNQAKSKNPTILLFKKYCEMNGVSDKSLKPIIDVYTRNDFKIPESAYMKFVERREAFCRLCDAMVAVKEKIRGSECSVCGFAFP